MCQSCAKRVFHFKIAAWGELFCMPHFLERWRRSILSLAQELSGRPGRLANNKPTWPKRKRLEMGRPKKTRCIDIVIDICICICTCNLGSAQFFGSVFWSCGGWWGAEAQGATGGLGIGMDGPMLGDVLQTALQQGNETGKQVINSGAGLGRQGSSCRGSVEPDEWLVLVAYS